MARSKADPNSQAARGPRGPGKNDQVKLLRRFYEPINLLFALGKTRGERTITSENDGTDEFKRRQFLNDLAYICDFTKGGATTTAIAVEDCAEQYIFWFALNATGVVADRAERFLGTSLSTIQQSLGDETAAAKEQSTQRLTADSMQAAKSRVTTELRFLQQHINRCIPKLQEGAQDNQRLLSWMRVFQDPKLDHMEICSLAYNHRHDSQMAILREKGLHCWSSADITDDSMSSYSGVQHYIGRLAEHIRRPMRLIQNSTCFQEVLDNPFTIRRTPSIPGVRVPPPDSETTLDKIVKRMLPADHPKLGEIQAALQKFDGHHKILDLVMAQYNDKPRCVHAEIQVLEHFWATKKLFAFNERFIGCSKSACYCCKRYIEAHRIRCFVPDSHENIYPTWSPPLLGIQDPEFSEKRKALQCIIDSVRASAIEQISQKSGRIVHPHQDSATAITRSMAGTGSIVRAGHIPITSVGALHPTAAWLTGATSPPLTISEDDTEPDSDAFARLDLSSSSDNNSLGSPATSISSAPSSPTLDELEPDSDSDSEDYGGVLLYGPGSRR
ncbi:uncharacterized protein PgNI_11571 [Pyricularia grisea]|uniref:Uncharacterized protein n=1 Tax=Pyricularia grisea TaxID=148305 RepID=A0A6P8ANU1_PYRGI|nr:uncharacterized protein PgNI_11571 [Pyricularia grisea]TLD03691.1 hypothetical protein PgNI_11571 [Pyricularia grisea]